ncbi:MULTISPECIES: ATP-dependent Clp protease ATP-binding subunit [Niastella]|uniref:ATP-dependent Clp protease ATP-binding subunit n=1 Tax=Niastella soli TaxID=2821487 RepID=A0ABS3Z593_9BACT|nr:ATP-dependent Clp protease ATP-binding subunit [Niastella soli]MBO9205321.1 ATP-dependent Clp protease ATP-binding subunit [Niastella soli]
MTDQLLGTTISDSCKKMNHIAQAIARENMHPHIAPPHLLKALLHKDAGLQTLLKQLDKDIYYMEEWAEVRMETLTKATRLDDTLTADEPVKAVMEEADTIRVMTGSEELENLHVLAALSTPGVGFSYEQLKTFPIQRQELLQQSIADNTLNKITGMVNTNGISKPSKHQALLKYCTHKNERAKTGKIDPITGRDKEIRAMAEILGRRSKPNVLIVGEPGVGKSALVDGFTLAIEEKKVPQFLGNAQVFELDNGALAAGASYKGEVEERLKNIIQEIKQFDKAILFIDEMHVLMDKQGAMAGAANLLKPELARGELTVIGATTLEEYRKHIEKDEAFARRFDVIQVEEPDMATTFRMMQIIMPHYSKHHAITVDDETLQDTIRLAKRYVKDRRLPDAAIDLADHSMAALRLARDTGKQIVSAMRSVFEEMQKGPVPVDDWKWHYNQLRNKISPILWAAVQSETDPMQMTEINEIINYLNLAYEALSERAADDRQALNQSDVAAIVAHKTGIPIGKVQAQEKERLLKMEEVLKQRVIGQDHAIRSISEAVLESRAGLGKPGQPIGSFFFLGPTGTGKTELAKALADFLFQDETSMIRFDMSEFKEEHSAALLYGAPPGYVGYEEGGLLINKIRQQPYSVVLFDEIEKAHQSVFDIFLQIMDEGKLHDKLGKEGDFSNALIIFTSNIGSQFVVESFNKGQVPSGTQLMEIMSNYFRPEFLGRLTEICPFAPMTNEMVERILNIQLKSLYSSLEKQGITLQLTDAAKKQLALQGFAPQYGARPLAGVIRNTLRRPLSRKIISGEAGAAGNAILILDVDDQGNFLWNSTTEVL